MRYAVRVRIFVTGATGAIGRRLVADRVARGDRVRVLSRRPDDARLLFARHGPSVEVIAGDPCASGAWQLAVEGCGAVIHLAGAGIMDARWTIARMAEIRRSRIESAQRLREAIVRMQDAPRVLVTASGTHFAGHCGDRIVDERAPFGADFLGSLCLAWEQAALGVADDAGVRTVALRIPFVLDAEVPAFRQMLAFAARGFVPYPGDGRAFVPWIHHADLVRIVALAIEDRAISGAILACAPRAPRMSELAASIGRAHPRGARGIAIPRRLSRLVKGRVVDALCASVRAEPRRLLMRSFAWRFPALDDAVADVMRDAAPARGKAAEARAVRPRAAILDLDHGAVDAHGMLREDAAETIALARARLVVVPFSRRPRGELPALSHRVFADAPALLSGGAVLSPPARDGATEPPVYAAFPNALLARVLADVAELDPRVGVIFERRDGFATPNADRLLHVRRGRALPHAEPRDILELMLGETLRIHLCDDIHGLHVVERWLSHRYARPGFVRLLHPSQGILTVSPAGSGIEERKPEIAEALGIPERETALAASLDELRAVAARA